MAGIASFPSAGSLDPVYRDGNWVLAVCHGTTCLSSKYPAGVFAARYAGEHQLHFGKSRSACPGLRRDFDVLGFRDLLELSERKPDPLHGGGMTSSVQNISGLDRVIHEPARLILVALLSSVESADFLFLLKESSLTKGNLSVQLSRLEEAGYVQPKKTFRGKIPHTEYRLTSKGKSAFDQYRKSLGSIFNEKKR